MGMSQGCIVGVFLDKGAPKWHSVEMFLDRDIPKGSREGMFPRDIRMCSEDVTRWGCPQGHSGGVS